MNRTNPGRPDVDDVLKQVLKDDLPPALEHRMRTQFVNLRRSLELSDQRYGWHWGGALKRLFSVLEWQSTPLLLRREVLAIASVLLIVFGGAMHLSGRHCALANSVFLLKMSISIASQVRQTSSMECKVAVPEGNGQFSAYVVRWVAPGKTRIDFEAKDGGRKTRWISDAVITVADRAKNTQQHSARAATQPEDSLFRPVACCSSPEQLAMHISGRWQLKRYERQAMRGSGTFLFTNSDAGVNVEMIVDLATFLPLAIEEHLPTSGHIGTAGAIIKRANFSWNQPIAPELMIPGKTGKTGALMLESARKEHL
jgi:hypothetical protein